MRIDPVLCQKILIAIESDPKAGSGQSLSPSVDGYEIEQIAHHVKYLWDESLITGDEATHLQSPYPGKHSYAEAVGFIKYAAWLSREEKEWILSATAKRLLNWPLLSG